MDTLKAAKDKRDAEMTEEFLEMVGWKDVIVPELEKERKAYLDALVKMILNPKVGETLGRTKEEIAGCIYGIDIVLSTIERIIKKGAVAAKAIEDNINKQSNKHL